MIDIREIRELYLTRKQKLDALQATAQEVQAIYRGKITFPLPEMDANERPMVANLLMTGVDQYGSRTASVLPDVYAPVFRDGRKGAKERAAKRREVWKATHDVNRLHLGMQKRARYYYAYAASPVMWRPDMKERRPASRLLHPFAVYPSEVEVNDLVPANTILASVHSLPWLMKHYPDAVRPINKHTSPDEQYTCLEYIDEYEYVYVVCGATHRDMPGYQEPATTVAGEVIELARFQNRCALPWVVYPTRISLEDPQGQFDGTTGIYYWWSMLMSLTVLGTKRGIWPEQWLEGDDAKVIREADPLRGIVGQITGGKLNTVTIDPNWVSNNNTMDRLERFIRLEGGVPPEMGGEAASNIRTGRRADQVLSAAIDFHIQQAHQMFEASLEEENRLISALDKAYFPGTKSIFVSMTQGELEYDPTELWETDRNVVRYSQAGLDIAQLTVAAGQRIGMDAMSVQTFQEMDPMVRDTEQERRRTISETLNRAVLGALEQRAVADPTFMEWLVKIVKKVNEGEDIISAYDSVMDEAREAQEAQAETGETPMPGLADTTQGAIGPPEPSLQNLMGTLNALRNPNRAVA